MSEKKTGEERAGTINEEWVIRKDEKVQINLFSGIDPYAIGHVVIQLNSGKHDISELEDGDWNILKEWVPKVSKAMKMVLPNFMGRQTVRIYLCSFNESPDYPVHFHLVPRYECEPLKGEELLYYRHKAEQPISPSVREAIVREMKKELDNNTD